MEKEKTIDFESFAETDTQIKSGFERDTSGLNGLAELKSCQVSEFRDEFEGIEIEQRYIIFEAIIHGSESGLVYIREDSELYDFILRFTSSETVSELAGQYIPVDKVESGVYQPSSSLATGIQEEFFDTDLFKDIQSLRKCIECGAINYNTDAHKWELIDKERCEIIYHDTLYSVVVSTCTSGILAVLLARYLNAYNLIIPIFLLSSLTLSYIGYKSINYVVDYLSDKKVPL